MIYEEKTVSEKKVFDGSIIKVSQLQVSLPNGKIVPRDMVYHPGASAVIPINDNGEIYMVRQYRKPFDREFLEIPAGKLDAGEDPAVCARRELKEETGLEAETIRHAVSIHTTPAFTNEVLHLYFATGLREGESNADEDEFISCEKYSVKQLVEMVLNHEITDAKSVIGILLADRMLREEK